MKPIFARILALLGAGVLVCLAALGVAGCSGAPPSQTPPATTGPVATPSPLAQRLQDNPNAVDLCQVFHGPLEGTTVNVTGHWVSGIKDTVGPVSVSFPGLANRPGGGKEPVTSVLVTWQGKLVVRQPVDSEKTVTVPFTVGFIPLSRFDIPYQIPGDLRVTLGFGRGGAVGTCETLATPGP